MEHLGKGLSRRNFIKGTAIVGLAGAAAGIVGCSSSSNSSNSNSSQETITVTNTETADIVVCGAGASGISAAVHAAESGAHVILLEKSTTFGGASLGVYSATVHQATDDISETVSTWVNDCHWRVSAPIISNLLHKSGEAFAWLTDTYGWNFTPTVSFGEEQQLVPGDATSRTALYQNMLDKSGVDLRLGMTAKQLVTDGSGAVTGVIALDTDGVGNEFDCKAVAIATGGYAGNADMVKEASGFGGVCGGLPQNIGEGLEMAWAVGGNKPHNYGAQMLHQTLAMATSTLSQSFDDLPAKYPFLTTYMPHFMNTTAQGIRFRNEGIILSADAAANSSAYQGDYHFVVVSGTQLKTLEAGGLAAYGITEKLSTPPDKAPVYELDTPWTNATAVFDAMAQTKYGFKGETPEELAAAASMDESVFVAAFNDYEGFCTAGKDTALGKDAQYLVPMGDGPYYLVMANENNLTSWGGVSTDIDYRVLDDTSNAIPGLYAIGVESGSNLYNDVYCGVGVGVCLVYTSGYLTGQHMVDYIKQA